MELQSTVSPELLGLEHSIENCLDFNAGERRGRPIIRFGLDENLDASKFVLVERSLLFNKAVPKNFNLN